MSDFIVRYCVDGLPPAAAEWDQFLTDYDLLVTPSARSICFAATYSGSRRGATGIAIDRAIRRLLTAFGVVRHDALVGVVTARCLGDM